MFVPALLLLAATYAHSEQPNGIPARCTRPPVQSLDESLRRTITQQNASLAAARVRGDVAELMAHYAPHSVVMPEHQPRLWGVQQAEAYYRALFARLPVSALTFTTVDILPLAGGGLEWGTFKLVYRATDGAAPSALDGKYVHLWRPQPDGRVKLAAEVWGYVAPLEHPSSHWFAGLDSAGGHVGDADPAIAAELAVLNAANAQSVQQHTPARIAQYAQDAVYLPYADAPQVGIAAIRSHLLPYIARGRSATFETVDVGNDGFDIVDGHVIEYSKFAVRWRSGDAAGITSGGGLRVWRREADCTLRIIRQIGTHDHRP